MSDSEEAEKYLTYKGMGITPMIGGVPLFLALGLVGVLALAMVCFIAGAPWFSVLLIIICIAVFMFFKVICENNNKAPEVFKVKIYGFFQSMKFGKIIKVDSGVENESEKRKKFRRGFKGIFESQ